MPKMTDGRTSAWRGCHRVAGHALATAACWALTLAVAAAAAAAPPAHAHLPASGRLAPSPTRMLDHWTRARIERARALPAVRGRASAPRLKPSKTDRASASAAAEPTFVPAVGPGERGSSRLRRGLVGEAATASVAGQAASEYGDLPASANGVLVGAFPHDGSEEEFRCSASVIDSVAGNLVLTAGHCVVDPESGEVARWLVFVPGYHEGSMPYGQWAATEYGITRQWAASAGSASGANEAGDVAILRMEKRETDGATLQSVVGGLGIGFGQPRRQTYTAYGYPAKSPYDGERLYSEVSAYAGLDPGFSPGPIKLSSDFTEGASGGPRTVGVSSPVVLSLNAYEYTRAPGYLYGPYFGAEARSLYHKASSGGSTPAGSDSERLRLTAVQHLPRRGSARLHVSVPLGGTLSLRGRGVAPSEMSVQGGSACVIVLRARGASLRDLRQTGRVSVKVMLINREKSTDGERRLSRTVQLIER